MQILTLILLLFIPFFCFAQAPSVFSEKHDIEVALNGSGFTEKVEFRGKIPAGLRPTFSVFFTELETVSKLRATRTNAKGKTVELKKKDFVQSSAKVGSSFYTGIERINFQMPAEASPYNFAYSYSKYHSDLMFFSSLWFDHSEESDSILYSIKVPSGFRLEYKFADSVEIKQEVRYSVREEGNFTLHEFFSDAVMRADSDKKALPPFARIIVCPEDKSGFTHYNQWYEDLVKEHSVLNPETKQALSEVTKGLDSDREKTAALFRFIQDRINYIDFENGIGAVQARDVNAVFLKKQGDCKDMSNLLCQALRAEGIQAYPAISSTLGHHSDLDFPSLSSANHCICVVPQEEGYIFLDATESEGLFGYPSRQIQGRKVFVVNEEEGELVDVPVVSSQENLVKRELKLQQSGLHLLGTEESVFNGLSQLYLRDFYKYTDKDKVQAHLRAYFSEQNKNLRYTDFVLRQDSVTSTISGQAEAQRVFTDIGKKFYLSLSFLPPPTDLVLRSEASELILYHREKQLIDISVQLSQEGKLKPFEPVELEENGIRFQFEIKQTNNRELKIHYSYENENLRMSGDTLQSFMKINQSIANLIAQTLVYEKSTTTIKRP